MRRQLQRAAAALRGMAQLQPEGVVALQARGVMQVQVRARVLLWQARRRRLPTEERMALAAAQHRRGQRQQRNWLP
jgi:hypothetical protein